MTITTDTTLLHDPRRQAALLYWQGFSVPQIAAMLQMKRPTVQSWKQRDGWDSVAPISRVEMSLEARLTQLIIKPQKTGGDFKEIDLLGRQIERLARVNRYSQTGNEADLNPNVANRNKGGRRKPKKNFFSDEAIEKLEQIFFEQSFDYQLHWYRAGLEHRIRDILKSRQIGATFYFSREALLRALKTGHNQIFLSASKTQAYVFREYIIAFARLVDVDLTGDPIVLGNNGAKLIFLGTNSNTAQSHNGDLYVDEIFWIPNFQVLRKVASGMASQSHLRSTYFSTPSTLAHDAYPFWSGELFNRGRASAAERVEIDVSHNALAGGLLCADGQWRQIVTIEDALKGGCTLFDIEQLKRENSADDFKNLFMCEFVDDKASCSRSRSCNAAWSTRWKNGKTMRRLPPIRSAPARYGLVTTRHTVATAPDAWCWHRRWWPVANSEYLSVTSGKAWILPLRRNPSANSPKNTTSNTSELMPPASVSACSSSCARSIPPRVISATRRK
ncbi:ATPase subunit of terminase family protein [Escherichia coli 2770900]|nr:ATPase subunit of terminase family protein [Escherichia coli 2770900]